MSTHRRAHDRRSYARLERLRVIVPRGAPTVSARRSPTFAEPRRASATHEHEHGRPRSASYPERGPTHHSAVRPPSLPPACRVASGRCARPQRAAVGRSVGRSVRSAVRARGGSPFASRRRPPPRRSRTPRRHDATTLQRNEATIPARTTMGTPTAPSLLLPQTKSRPPYRFGRRGPGPDHEKITRANLRNAIPPCYGCAGGSNEG